LEQRQGVHAREDELQHAILRLRLLQTQVQTDKNAHLEQMRRAARFQNDEVSQKAQVDNLRREHDRLRQKSVQAAEHLASLDVELQELGQADEALQARLDAVRETFAEQRQERDQARQRHEEINQLI